MRIASSVPRFAIVGAIATLIHMIVAVGIIKMVNWHPGIANGIAYIVANFFSYAVNTRWSFEAKVSLDSWYRFLAVSFIAWLLTVAISGLVAAAGGHYMLGILLVVVLVPTLSYIGHRKYTYR